MFEDLLDRLLNAPKRDVKMVYVASFRLPTFNPGEAHGRDYLILAREGTRKAANEAMEKSMAANQGMVFIREGRKVQTYTQSGVYMGYYTVTAQEEV